MIRCFFAPFVPFFDPRHGRPSIPMETYLRLMFLKFRYRLGYETLCGQVTDSISWQRFARIPLGTRVPHPAPLVKITTKCGDATVTTSNDALLAKAAAAKLLRVNRGRADTTVVPAAVAYPTDSGFAGQGGRADVADGEADQGRGRRDPHRQPGPAPSHWAAQGPAVAGPRRPGRHHRAGRPGRDPDPQPPGGPKLERTRERDMLDGQALARAGWKVVRLWEHLPLADAVASVEAALAAAEAQISARRWLGDDREASRRSFATESRRSGGGGRLRTPEAVS